MRLQIKTPRHVRSLALLSALLSLFFPAPLFAHHISMSVSEWELDKESAKLLFRLPLGDAVWTMDPSLVLVSEAGVRLKGPVDEKLKARVADWVKAELPAKVKLAGCEFQPEMKVWFEGGSVQVKAGLSCRPGYLKDFKLTSRFLVEKNRLHTSLAALRFPGRVEQCLFRFGQFTCGAAGKAEEGRAAAPWQAVVYPFWDYLALAAVFLLAPAPLTRRVNALSLLILGHGLGPLLSLSGQAPPSEITLRPLLAGVSLAGGLHLLSINRARQGRWLGLLIFITAVSLSWAEFFRVSVLMVAGLLLLAWDAAGGSPEAEAGEEKGARVYEPADSRNFLLVFAFTFGMVHGLLLERRGWHLLELPGSPLFIILGAAILAFPFRGAADRFPRMTEIAGLILLAGGAAVFSLRNVTLSFDAFQYRNAVDLLNQLIRAPRLAPSFLIIIIVLALLIGGLHALTPGHGKTIVAAYLVGTKGRLRDAAVLGAIVTFTHTFSVIVLGLLVLFASKFILPDQLVPWLSAASGLLILCLGVYLFQQRLRNYLRYGAVSPVISSIDSRHQHDHDHHHHEPDREHPHYHEHDHDHEHDHEHDHNHEHEHGHEHDFHESHEPGRVRKITHSHDGITHTHVLPAAGVSLGSLVALGVTGGIVPCPDALAVLLISVSLNRVVLGLVVILAFSLGLAAVLIAIGIMVVKARPIMDRFTGEGRFTNLYLPLLSAAVVTFLGGVMLWKAWPF